MDEHRWPAFKERMKELVRLGDYAGMAALYREISRVLHDEGKDFYFMAQHAIKMDLAAIFHAGGTERVAITTAGHRACEPCRLLEGKILSIMEAMTTMPLPVRECDAGLCCCIYTPHFE